MILKQKGWIPEQNGWGDSNAMILKQKGWGVTRNICISGNSREKHLRKVL